jgi:preprotein translocase subunit SecG
VLRFAGAADDAGARRERRTGGKRGSVDTAINIVMIIVSVVLILVILLQTKGSSFSGAFGGDTSSIYRTRRGVEKTLFQFTIGIAAVFVLLAIVSTIAGD